MFVMSFLLIVGPKSSAECNPTAFGIRVFSQIRYTALRTKRRPKKRVIGIGVTQPATLNLHADNKSKRMKQSDWIKFYQRVISDLRAQGFVVELFTNGAQNDQIFAGQILNAWMRDNGENR